MWWWCSAVALAAGLPSVGINWKGEAATLSIVPPAAHHLAKGAPAHADLRWGPYTLVADLSSEQAAQGIPLGDVRGSTLQGSLQVSICDDGGTNCTPVALDIRGAIPNSKKGSLALQATAPTASATAPAHSPYQQDAAAVAAAAMAKAKAESTRVVLDFGAVWCPPCNLLSAEVLHAPEPPGVLDSYVVAQLDVDDPSSWALKDRYHVLGYPTVVITDAAGNELSRKEGYDGRDDFVDWLLRLADQAEPDVDYTQVDPASVDPAKAAEVALRLTLDHQDVTAWLARAAAEPDNVDLHLARFAVTPSPEQATWLAAHAQGRALDWVFNTGELDDAVTLKAVREAVAAELPSADGLTAGDLLYAAAAASEPTQASLLYGAAAAAVSAAATGDDEVDRAQWTWLASLRAKSGDVDGAISLLESASQRYPDEPTFLLSLSGILRQAERLDAALDAADRALSRSWGDNRLRVVSARAKVLFDLNRGDEARSFIEAELAKAPAPQAGLKVRTHRYREHLQQLLDAPED